MGCYRQSRLEEDLRRCGCRQCYEEYNRMKYRSPRDEYRHYIDSPNRPMIRTMDTIKITAGPMEGKKMVEAPKEEIKNFAVKNLVDDLKAEQAKLKTAENGIEYHKTAMKPYAETKLKSTKNIKDLALALNKLGHKE